MKTKHKAALIGLVLTLTGIGAGIFVKDRAGIVVGTCVTTIGLIASFWLLLEEFSTGVNNTKKEISHDLVDIAVSTKQTFDQILKVGAEVEDAIKQLEEHTIPINPLILNDVTSREYATQVLAQVDGMEFLKQSYILSDAAKALKAACYDKHFPKNYDEKVRVFLLVDVIDHAKEWVYAFSYADRDHMEGFWNKHKNPALADYLLAHEHALKGRTKSQKFRLVRVFLREDNLPEDDPATCTILCEVLGELLARGMTDLYMVTESSAAPKFAKKLPLRSFFIADDCFVSEGKSARVPNKQPYARFTNPLDKFMVKNKQDFEKLMSCISGPVTAEDVQSLRVRMGRKNIAGGI